MRKLALLLILCATVARGQTISFFNEGFLRQPSAAADRTYLGITGGGSTNSFYSNTATNWLGSNSMWSALSLNPFGYLAAPIPNADLAHSAVTYNGKTVSLGGSATLTLDSSDYVGQGGVHQVLHGGGVGNPSWGVVDLANDVSGSLPAAAIGSPPWLLANQTITLSGDTTGSGSTAITTTLNSVSSKTAGQVLTATAGGIGWSNLPSGGSLFPAALTNLDSRNWTNSNTVKVGNLVSTAGRFQMLNDGSLNLSYTGSSGSLDASSYGIGGNYSELVLNGHGVGLAMNCSAGNGQIFIGGANPSIEFDTTPSKRLIITGPSVALASGTTIYGNGNGLTNIPSTSITGGITTNITVLTVLPSTFNTLCFTNGILMNVQ